MSTLINLKGWLSLTRVLYVLNGVIFSSSHGQQAFGNIKLVHFTAYPFSPLTYKYTSNPRTSSHQYQFSFRIVECTSVIPPARLFKAFVLDADSLIPKIAPQAFKNAEILEGDGGIGTIKKINLGQGSEYSYVKHQVDGIDKENCVYNYSMIEGDAISDKIEKISYETKLVASFDGGSIIRSTSNYHTKGDEIKEEHVKAGKERAAGLFKIVESHLVANPDAYN